MAAAEHRRQCPALHQAEWNVRSCLFGTSVRRLIPCPAVLDVLYIQGPCLDGCTLGCVSLHVFPQLNLHLAAMTSSILLRGGTVLQHGAGDSVLAVATDVLVEDKTITRIGPSLEAPSQSTKVLDCHGKIITPGFVDTHRHLWQTQLKGRHANQALMPYMLTGNIVNSLYTPGDAELGTLAGALESIDAGTTTVVDHTSMAVSAAHLEAVLAGAEASGVRAVVCPAVARYVEQWQPKLRFHGDPLPAWFEPAWEQLADRTAATEGRVSVGLAFDAWDLEAPRIQALFARVRKHSPPARVVTAHHSACRSPATCRATFRWNSRYLHRFKPGHARRTVRHPGAGCPDLASGRLLRGHAGHHRQARHPHLDHRLHGAAHGTGQLSRAPHPRADALRLAGR